MEIADIFQYAFMRRAFIAGILIAIIIPCVGLIVVVKRLSTMGDALAHCSLAGVAAGLLLGINPVVGAMGTAVAAALGMESIRRKIPKYSGVSVAILMSAGVGITGILSGMVKSSAGFDSFLFGSIVAVSEFELWLVAGVCIFITIAFFLLYRVLFFIGIDERGAASAGVPVRTVNVIFTVLTAIAISVAGRTIGMLIVSSLMVVPVVCAMQLAKSFKQTVLTAIVFAIVFTVGGLFISFYADVVYQIALKPGATIVLLGTLTLILIFLLKGLAKRVRTRRKAA